MSESCQRLHALFAQQPKLSFPFDRRAIPRNGIYILFEQGEHGHGGERVVRVGTHTGDNQLPSRLEQHFCQENKDRSIFRKNIGRALLCKDNDPFLEQWNRDLTTSAARARYGPGLNREKLTATEQMVTDYMRRSFRFVVFGVDSTADRLHLEACLISTVSGCSECGPSADWLGRFSPKQKIRQSGLWQVNELCAQPLTVGELDAVERLLL